MLHCLVILVIATATLLTSASQAVASHPHLYGERCTNDRFGDLFEAPDDELWVCDYNDEFDVDVWIPLRPRRDPSDAVVYKQQTVTDSQGIQYLVTSRLEWVGNQLYGGADVLMFTAPGVRYTAPVSTIGHKVRLYSYDGATSKWSVCRESNWAANTTAPTTGVMTTWAWGTAPCGWRWYYLVGYAMRQINGTWTQVTPPEGVYTFGGTTLAGTTPSGDASAVNGMIWDPKPGDGTKPPKPPKVHKKLLKKDPPEVGTPVSTAGIANF